MMPFITRFVIGFLIGYSSTLIIINYAKAGGPEYCEPVIIEKVVEKIVYVTKTVEMPIEITKEVTKKNRVSLLGGYGPTDNLKYQVLSPSLVQVENVNRANLGLMYQRDLGKLTVGAFGLTNETMGLSLGLNW